MSLTEYGISRFKFVSQKDVHYYRYMITKGSIPLLDINIYIEQKSLRNSNTGKQYAKKLVVFLNWLDQKELSYEDATNYHVKAFLHNLIYGNTTDERQIQSLKPRLSYSTLSSYITIITDFYRWLDENYETNIHFHSKQDTKRSRKSYLFGQIYSYDYKYIVDRYLPRLNSSKDYIKWYTSEEKTAICLNFKTLRDECIFRFTLEGMRIDEALSVRLDDFDAEAGIIKPSRSKGKVSVEPGRENHLRVITLPSKTLELLKRYISTERMLAENESMNISQYIFINIKAGKHQGQPISYRNYLRVLKSTVEKAGLDSHKIRTHSGRSTKVMDVLEYGALNPKNALTDVEILETFGWKSTDSIESYRNHNNPIIAKSLIEKLNKMEGKDHD